MTNLISDDVLAQKLAASPAPRVTKEQMEGRIASVDYHRIGTTVTLCNLMLDNGYSVRGESACVDPANFNEEIGNRIAYDQAFRQLWPLFGFLLAEQRHTRNGGVAEIARVCHEVNRAYCASIGDTSQVAWQDAPDWQKDSAIKGVQFTLDNPNAGPSASHESWLKEKEATGWKYGPVKDAEKKEHPCFVPYDQLPVEQRTKDYLFQAVVRALAYLLAEQRFAAAA